MTHTKSTYTDYLGIDVGKYTLEIAWEGNKNTFRYDNNKAGWNALWKDHKKQLKGALVVLETTGWFERGIAEYLVKNCIAVHRAPARRIKQYIASYGTLAKTDAIDAKALAQYAKERAQSLTPYDIPDATLDELRMLYARNIDLKKMLVQEKNRLQAPGYKHMASSVRAVMRVLEKEIGKVMKDITLIIEKNPILRKKFNILQTIDGVGAITAIALLATMPELGSINRKQAASLAGLAPHAKDSGNKKGYRKTTGGRHMIKEITNMAALGAIRKKQSTLKDFYLHLINNNNKKPMVALTAVKRKIIVIANARLQEI